MAKDSQLDPKDIRKAKAKGGTVIASSEHQSDGNNAKKQTGSRQKSGDDKK